MGYTLVRELIHSNKTVKHIKNFVRLLDEKNDPLSGHLFSLSGDKWKNLRVKVNERVNSEFELISQEFLCTLC